MTRRPRTRNFAPYSIVCSLTLALALPVAFAGPAPAATVKAGSSCTKAQVNARRGSLKCTKVGTKYRWQTVPAGTSPATPAPSSAASGSKSGTPITAEALGTALGGVVTVDRNDAIAKLGLQGNELNPDGRCHLDALVYPLAGCSGTFTAAWVPAGTTWSIIGYKGTENTLDNGRRAARATVGTGETLFSPTSYGPDSAVVYWLPANGSAIRFEGSIRYFALRLRAPAGSAIGATDAMEDAMLRAAGVAEAALVNR